VGIQHHLEGREEEEEEEELMFHLHQLLSMSNSI
jgi:hypothetical protein